MAISKVAASLREQGYPVGVANVATDSGILSVPFVTDPASPDPRDCPTAAGSPGLRAGAFSRPALNFML